MYCSHFGLQRPPFNNTPDPSFYYSTSGHEEALASLQYAVLNRKGFVLVTGEVGAGKTLIGRMFIRQIDSQASTAIITHTQLSPDQLLAAICSEFELPVPENATYLQLSQILQDYLLEQLARDRRVVVLIDEGQSLSDESFEALRMLGNLEADDAKLLQVCIFGQPELRDRFRQEELRQLDQRLFCRFHLSGLTQQQTSEYIQRRLEVAGSTRNDLFSNEAMTRVFEGSNGIPRLINRICDNALLTAYAQGLTTVEAPMIDQVIEQEEVMNSAGVASAVHHASGADHDHASDNVYSSDALNSSNSPNLQTAEPTHARIERIYGSAPEWAESEKSEESMSESASPACVATTSTAATSIASASTASTKKSGKNRKRLGASLNNHLNKPRSAWLNVRQSIDNQQSVVQKMVDSAAAHCQQAETQIEQLAATAVVPIDQVEELRQLHAAETQRMLSEIQQTRTDIEQMIRDTESRLSETEGRLNGIHEKAITHETIDAIERQQEQRVEEAVARLDQHHQHINYLIESLRQQCDQTQISIGHLIDSSAQMQLELDGRVDRKLEELRHQLQEQLQAAGTVWQEQLQAADPTMKIESLRKSLQETLHESLQQTRTQTRIELTSEFKTRLAEMHAVVQEQLEATAKTGDLDAIRNSMVKTEELDDIRASMITPVDLETIRASMATSADLNAVRESMVKPKDLEAIRQTMLKPADLEVVHDAVDQTATAIRENVETQLSQVSQEIHKHARRSVRGRRRLQQVQQTQQEKNNAFRNELGGFHNELSELKDRAATRDELRELKDCAATRDELQELKDRAISRDEFSTLEGRVATCEELHELKNKSATRSELHQLQDRAATRDELYQLQQQAVTQEAVDQTATTIRENLEAQLSQVSQEIRKHARRSVRGRRQLRQTQQEKNSGFRNELSEFHNELGELKDRAATRDELRELKNQAVSRDELHHLQEQAATRDELNELRNQSATREELHQLKEQAAAREELHQNIQELRQNADDVKSQHDGLLTQHDGLLAQHGELLSEHQVLVFYFACRVAHCEEQIKSMSEDATARLAAVESELSAAKAETVTISQVDALCQEHLSAVTQMANQLENKSAELTAMKGSLEELLSQASHQQVVGLEHLSAQLDRESKQVEQLRMQIDETHAALRDQLSSLQTTVQSECVKRGELETLQQNQAELKTWQQSQVEQTAAFSKEIAEDRTKLEQAQQKFEQAQQTFDQSLQKVDQAQQNHATQAAKLIEAIQADRSQIESLRQSQAEHAAQVAREIQGERVMTIGLIDDLTKRLAETQDRLGSVGQHRQIDQAKFDELSRVHAADISDLLQQLEDQRSTMQKQFDKALVDWSKTQENLENLRTSTITMDALDQLRELQIDQSSKIRESMSQQRSVLEEMIRELDERIISQFENTVTAISELEDRAATREELQELKDRAVSHDELQEFKDRTASREELDRRVDELKLQHSATFAKQDATFAQQDATLIQHRAMLDELTGDVARCDERIASLRSDATDQFAVMSARLNELKAESTTALNETTQSDRQQISQLQQQQQEQIERTSQLSQAMRTDRAKLQNARKRHIKHARHTAKKFEQHQQKLEQLRQLQAQHAVQVAQEIRDERSAVDRLIENLNSHLTATLDRMDSVSDVVENDHTKLDKLSRTHTTDMANLLKQLEDQRQLMQEQFDRTLADWTNTQENLENLRASAVTAEALEELRELQADQSTQIRESMNQQRSVLEGLIRALDERFVQQFNDSAKTLSAALSELKSRTISRDEAAELRKIAISRDELNELKATAASRQELHELKKTAVSRDELKELKTHATLRNELNKLKAHAASRDELQALARAATPVQQFHAVKQSIHQDLATIKQQIKDAAVRRNQDVHTLADVAQRLTQRVKTLEETDRPQSVTLELQPQFAQDLAGMMRVSEQQIAELRNLLSNAGELSEQLRTTSTHVEQVMQQWATNRDSVQRQSNDLAQSVQASGQVILAIRKCNDAMEAKLNSKRWQAALRASDLIAARLERVETAAVKSECLQQACEQMTQKLGRMLTEAKSTSQHLGQLTHRVGSIAGGIARKTAGLASLLESVRELDEQQRPTGELGHALPSGHASLASQPNYALQSSSVSPIAWPNLRTHVAAQAG